MNNITSRANVILANSLSVLAACTGLLFITTITFNVEPKFDITVNKAEVGHKPDYMSGNLDYLDIVLLDYDLSVDVEKSFNWNVKMIFLYLVAEYESEDNVLNQSVLWDKIVMRGDKVKIDLNRASPKYFFFDDKNNMRSNTVKLSLHWNVVPNAGLLPNRVGSGSVPVKLPQSYTTRSRY